MERRVIEYRIDTKDIKDPRQPCEVTPTEVLEPEDFKGKARLEADPGFRFRMTDLESSD